MFDLLCDFVALHLALPSLPRTSGSVACLTFIETSHIDLLVWGFHPQPPYHHPLYHANGKMALMHTVLAYAATLIPLVVLDMLWLLVVAKKFYASQMGFLFAKSINIAPVLFFYPLYALAILVLVVMPAVSAGAWTIALTRGALLGFAAYGAYDLTNQATISGWPTMMTLVDMGWGALLTALTSVIAYFIIMYLK
jgi:uncharacterized membrane protein